MPLTQYFFLSLVLPQEGMNFPQNPSPGNFLSVLLLSKNETHTKGKHHSLSLTNKEYRSPWYWNLSYEMKSVVINLRIVGLNN